MTYSTVTLTDDQILMLLLWHDVILSLVPARLNYQDDELADMLFCRLTDKKKTPHKLTQGV